MGMDWSQRELVQVLIKYRNKLVLVRTGRQTHSSCRKLIIAFRYQHRKLTINRTPKPEPPKEGEQKK
jgi:thioredoxin reductase